MVSFVFLRDDLFRQSENRSFFEFTDTINVYHITAKQLVSWFVCNPDSI